MAKTKTQNLIGTNASVIRDNRIRIGYQFWLNVLDDQQNEIAGMIEDELKPARLFAKAVREGLMIWYELRRGGYALLGELFPGVVASIQRDAIADYQNHQSIDTHDLVQELLAVVQRGNAAAPVAFRQLDIDSLPDLVPVEMESITATEARENFSSGFGDLFGSDDDEWD